MQNYIGAQHKPIADARFVPPPVTEMHEALDLWERDLHLRPEPLPLLVRLAVAHYQQRDQGASHASIAITKRVNGFELRELSVSHERLTFNCRGPAPPYSFVDVKRT